MVFGLKIKKSKTGNFQTHSRAYPRDIWEFISKSSERVGNTRTGCPLSDVLYYQSMTPRKKAQMERENAFPKTVFPVIDPERLKPRVITVDPDMLQARAALERRKHFLDHKGNGSNTKKDSILGTLKGHFDVQAAEKIVTDYHDNRPEWLKPKDKGNRVVLKEDKTYDVNKGISKAEQEEMMDAAVFASAQAKSERGNFLRLQFRQNLLEGKLSRVATDLALNRVFFQPELEKLRSLDSHFETKMVDPNLRVDIIESASPTKFFEMVHRRLNPKEFRPRSYEDIVLQLTPDPDDNLATASTGDWRKSPYLTYVPSPGTRFHHRQGDDDRWGRRTIQDVYTLAGDETRPLPRGVGRAATSMSRKVNIRDSPWMGGGAGPAMEAARKGGTQSAAGGPILRKVESSTFITQKSGPV